MSNLITSAQFQKLMVKNNMKVFTDADMRSKSAMIPMLFDVVSSDSQYEEFFNVESIGDIPRFNGTLSYLSMSPGYYRRIEPAEFAAGVNFERKLLADKKFAVLDNMNEELAFAMNRTEEKDAASLFGNAFSAAFSYETSEEGLALCSTAHTTKVPGVSTASGFSNSGTTAISKTAIAAARLAGARFRLGNGELANVNLDTLIVPLSLYDTACELVGYDPRNGAKDIKDPGNANNTINVIQGMKVIPWVLLDDYDTNNWFMVDSRLMKKQLKWIDREKADFNTSFDFETFGVRTSVYRRYGFGPTGWNFIYGSNVS